MTHRGGTAVLNNGSTSSGRRRIQWNGRMTWRAKMCICNMKIYRDRSSSEILAIASTVNARAGGGVFPEGFGSSQIQNVVRAVTGPLYLVPAGSSYRYPQDAWIRGLIRDGFHFLWCVRTLHVFFCLTLICLTLFQLHVTYTTSPFLI